MINTLILWDTDVLDGQMLCVVYSRLLMGGGMDSKSTSNKQIRGVRNVDNSQNIKDDIVREKMKKLNNSLKGLLVL